MADQDIPELKREQLGIGVRGKYFKAYTENSNVVVLIDPELAKAFPTSEAVNNALAGLLSIASEARKLTEKPRSIKPITPSKTPRAPKKHVSA
jgi:hypothetical protein